MFWKRTKESPKLPRVMVCRVDPDETRALARRLRAWLAEGEAPKTTGPWAGSHHA